MALGNNQETYIEYCPEDGSCSFEVKQNEQLILKHDNFGMLYPELLTGDKVVLKFEYKRNQEKDVYDGSYTEQVFIELDPDQIELEKENLKGIKILFARLCYCKGQTGYYRVKEGKIIIKKLQDKTYEIELKFKIHDIPQIITQIKKVFNLL
ncbi:hypothetical protein [Flavivirga spongiicola]|uniref:Uncharacterized protein n=1 Tax=Flavivirga spongiicola TaxID=421621 RepID=A0ABU7XW99_9FLAO|nr:hypothetical protein [Flavivirga sp. MEBiC05379]MDO5979215.1 hypothetical protein [Flavivirga sp. MEBiC05379]